MGSALISMSGRWRCRQWDRLPIPCRVDGGIGNGISRQLYAELMVESVVDWPKIPCRVGGEVWCAGSMVDNLHQFRARSMVVAAVQSVQISSPLEKALLRCMSLCVGCPSSLVGCLFILKICRLFKPQIIFQSNLSCSNRRSATTSFLGSDLVIGMRCSYLQSY